MLTRFLVNVFKKFQKICISMINFSKKLHFEKL